MTCQWSPFGDVLGPGFEGDQHQVVLVDGPVDRHDRPCARTATTPRRARPSTRRSWRRSSDVGPCPVAVVGQALDDERHPARGVALVGDLLVADALELAVPRLMARSMVSSGTDAHGPSGTWCGGSGWCRYRPRPRVPPLHLTNQLGEQLAPGFVGRPFLVLDGRPFANDRTWRASSSCCLGAASWLRRNPCSRVPGQLGVERRDQDRPLAAQHRRGPFGSLHSRPAPPRLGLPAPPRAPG